MPTRLSPTLTPGTLHSFTSSGPIMLALLLTALPFNSSAPNGTAAAERGLAVLEKGAAKWRNEHECSTCHHGTMTLWAFAEAKVHGYKVSDEFISETARWTKDRFLENIDKPRDSRPGWNMVSTPSLYLAVMAKTVPSQSVVTDDDLTRITGHLLRHQEADGSWSWAAAPAKNRPPPFFESDEVVTRLAMLALVGQHEDGVREARTRAEGWLEKAKRDAGTQAAVLHLLMLVRAGAGEKTVASEVEKILSRQQEDGGWGQQPDCQAMRMQQAKPCTD